MTAPKITTTDDGSSYTHLLMIAPPKVGKTFTTAKTSTKDLSKTLMVMADDGGARTLKTHRIMTPRCFIPGKTAYQSTVDLLIQLSAKCPYDVVVFDSASMLQQKIKAEIMRKDFPGGVEKRDRWPFFGKLLDRMREIVWRAHDLPAHIIWTAWLREPFSDRMGGAQLEGQTADMIEGNVDGIICMERVRDSKQPDGFRYQFRTKPFFISKTAGDLDNSGQVNANNRLGLPDPFPADVAAMLAYDATKAPKQPPRLVAPTSPSPKPGVKPPVRLAAKR